MIDSCNILFISNENKNWKISRSTYKVLAFVDVNLCTIKFNQKLHNIKLWLKNTRERVVIHSRISFVNIKTWFVQTLTQNKAFGEVKFAVEAISEVNFFREGYCHWGFEVIVILIVIKIRSRDEYVVWWSRGS